MLRQLTVYDTVSFDKNKNGIPSCRFLTFYNSCEYCEALPPPVPTPNLNGNLNIEELEVPELEEVLPTSKISLSLNCVIFWQKIQFHL